MTRIRSSWLNRSEMVSAIPRTAWQGFTTPVTGPPRRKRFSQGVIHHEGANRDVTPRNIAAHLRSMQSSYLASRGYSLGYGFAVVSDVRHPEDGSRWEIRGTDLNMASNPGQKWNAERRLPAGNVNDWTGSIIIIGPTGVPVSPKAAAAIRTILAEWHAETGTVPVRPFPHSTTDYTACCGSVYRANLEAGLFDPRLSPPPPIPTPVPPTPVPPTQGVPDVFTPIPIFRNTDSRVFGGLGIAPNVEHRFALHPDIFPANTVAVALNLTLPSVVSGYVTVWPDGEPRRDTSVAQFDPTRPGNGSIIVGVRDRHFKVWLSAGAHVICDISGYWTP